MSIVAKKILMASEAEATPSDDQFNRVSFLSHFEGANNGVNNAFDDGSTSNHTVTAVGNVTQGSFGPFARPDGEFSVLFDGDGDRLSVPTSSDFGFGTGDYTISFMVFLTVINSYDTILAVGSGVGGLGLFIHNGVNLAFGRAGTEVDVAFANVFTGLGQWNSIVFKRASGVVTVYVNGTSVGTNNTSSSQFDYQAAAITIGTEANGSSNAFGGFISNFRIVKGTALTPSSGFPTSKLNAVTNTVLLTCQSNRFVDNSASSHTITPAGNVAVTASSPFQTSSVYDPAVNGASAFFDGSGDALSTPSMTINGTGNFTLELWTYMTSTGGNRTFATFNDAGGATNLLQFYVRNGEFKLYSNAGGVRTFSGYAAENQWSFVHLSRSGSTFTLKVNNVSRGTVSGSENLNGVLGIGAYVAGSIGDPYKGYMYNYRVSNNIRSSAIPTQPLGTDSNTKLLLNMADGQAIDSTAQSNLTLFGGAKISTGQAKFGNTSLVLDGSGDAAQINSSNVINFGSGPFTIEMFLRLDSGSSNKTEIFFDGRGDAGSQGLFPTLEVKHTDDTVDYYTNSNIKISSGALTRGQFYHIAVCRSGTSTKMFIDGTQVGNTYSDSAVYISSSKVQLGRYYNSPNHDFHGEIDELRISKMARYTSNFTAPSEPFLDKGR